MNIRPYKVSFVIPVYNSQSSIKELVLKIQNVILSNSQVIDPDSEIILVDDYSLDRSWDKIKNIKETTSFSIKAIRLAKNYGQHNATLCGIKYASKDYVVTIDDDLEFNPEDTISLIRKMSETSADVVYGVDPKKKNSFVKIFFRKMFKLLIRVYHGNTKIDGSSFRLLKIDLAKDLVEHAQYFSFLDEFITWHTTSIEIVNVKCLPSKQASSNYNLFSLIGMAIELIFFSSRMPLLVVKMIGSFLVIFNFFWGSYIIYKKLAHGVSVDGYTSLIVSVLFSSGLIIFSLGVIADYINRLLKSSYKQHAFKEKELL